MKSISIWLIVVLLIALFLCGVLVFAVGRVAGVDVIGGSLRDVRRLLLFVLPESL